jgi:preprotein translocase subunit SecA
MEEQWDIKGLEEALQSEMGVTIPIRKMLKEDDSMHEESIRDVVIDQVDRHCAAKESQVGSDVIRHLEKSVMLQVLDNQWKEHLSAVDHLRRGIHLRGYAQKDPKQEYKREAFQMFSRLLDSIKQEVTGILCRVQLQTEEEVDALDDRRGAKTEFSYEHAEAQSSLGESEVPEVQEELAQQPKPFKREGRKVGRNEPCPCGSGKKYKQCHGRLS